MLICLVFAIWCPKLTLSFPCWPISFKGQSVSQLKQIPTHSKQWEENLTLVNVK